MNFKTYFSLLSLVLLFASCTLLMPEEKRQCYSTLKDFADEYWSFTSHDSILLETKKMFNKTVEVDGDIPNCVKKMDTNDIKRLFGTPHQIVYKKNQIRRYYYFSLMSCYPSLEESRFCSYYAFYFNNNGICTDIGVSGKQTSH
ncbi:hypothetical protein [Salibacter halophilus]|uniref:Lipoprotein n=1 Tax=Salibacter halophilus TaxID=1803916 RepID=A0A6N6M184_9FLAO|nr:hypothetical protein [Salibacter halophilus]KAB1062048.1 hypothetical protein F3059_13305 [Salibacter halophilus]